MLADSHTRSKLIQNDFFHLQTFFYDGTCNECGEINVANLLSLKQSLTYGAAIYVGWICIDEPFPRWKQLICTFIKYSDIMMQCQSTEIRNTFFLYRCFCCRFDFKKYCNVLESSSCHNKTRNMQNDGRNNRKKMNERDADEHNL